MAAGCESIHEVAVCSAQIGSKSSVEQIEAGAQLNHCSDHSRFLATLFTSQLVSNEPQSAVRAMLPEVDTMKRVPQGPVLVTVPLDAVKLKKNGNSRFRSPADW